MDKKTRDKKRYAEKREDILNAKRTRYATDVEFREAVKLASRMRKARVAATGTSDNIHRRISQWDIPRLMRLTVDGQPYLMRMYTIRMLAAKLGKSKQSLHSLIGMGIIPHPIWKISARVLLFTEDQIGAICRAHNACLVNEKTVQRWSDSQFGSMIRAEYRKLNQGIDMERYLATMDTTAQTEDQIDDAHQLTLDEVSKLAILNTRW